MRHRDNAELVLAHAAAGVAAEEEVGQILATIHLLIGLTKLGVGSEHAVGDQDLATARLVAAEHRSRLALRKRVGDDRSSVEVSSSGSLVEGGGQNGSHVDRMKRREPWSDCLPLLAQQIDRQFLDPKSQEFGRKSVVSVNPDQSSHFSFFLRNRSKIKIDHELDLYS